MTTRSSHATTVLVANEWLPTHAEFPRRWWRRLFWKPWKATETLPLAIEIDAKWLEAPRYTNRRRSGAAATAQGVTDGQG